MRAVVEAARKVSMQRFSLEAGVYADRGSGVEAVATAKRYFAEWSELEDALTRMETT